MSSAATPRPVLLRFRWKLFFGFFGAVAAVALLVSLLLRPDLLVPWSERAAGSIFAFPAPLLGILLVALGGAIVPALLIASRLNRPIRRIEQTMRAVEQGKLDARVEPLRTFDEFEPLIAGFNRMLEAVEERDLLAASLEAERRRVSALSVARDRLAGHVVKSRRQIVRIAADLQDVVGQHRTTLARLSESEERYRELVAQAPVGIIQADARGRIELANEYWLSLCGGSPTAVLGGCTKLHPDDRAGVAAQWREALESGRGFSLDFRVLGDLGAIRWVSGRVRPLLDQGGALTGYLGTVTDVTEREQAARERERIFTLSLDPICLAGTDGYYKRVNAAFERTLGFTSAELRAEPILAFVHPDDVAATVRELQGLRAGHAVVDFENRLRCKDGGFRSFQWMAVPLPDEGLVYAIARDLTDFRRADEAEHELLANRTELAIARDIQRSLLPPSPPVMPGYEAAALSQPATSVGGDYYDFIPCGEGCWAVVVADAAGHGVSAALLMAQTSACLRALMRAGGGIERMLEGANEVLHAGTPANAFVTLTLFLLDSRRGTLRHVGCGHPTSFLLREDGEVRARFPSTGLPLGCFGGITVTCSPEQPFEPGDTLLIVTDGLLEATDAGGEPLGEDRLLALARAGLHKPVADLVDDMHRGVHRFSPTAHACDDLTALVLRRTAQRSGLPAGAG